MLACAVGCTQTFGLDSARDDDRDGDQVADGSDNCPDVPNHDQSRHDLSDPRGDACRVCMTSDSTDSDGDGIPDQCDGCDNRLPDGNHNGIPDACENPHDEDGDGVPDLVDNCPSVANPDQADTLDSGPGAGLGFMPDGVGDRCDDSIGPDGQFFDAFVERNQLWLTSGEWQDGNDHAIVDMVGMAPSNPTRLAGLGLGTFSASAAVTLTGTGAAGLVAYETADEQFRVACAIHAVAGRSYLAISVSSTAAPTVSPKELEITPRMAGTLVLAIAPAPTFGQNVTCSIDNGPSVTLMLMTANLVWHPGLSSIADANASGATGTAQFDFYDVVTSLP